ncbi:MAG: radical SAM protein [Lachnospiraceae bacterium]
MGNCHLCPRNCGIDRTKEKGVCGQTEEIRLARAALHLWEEPCISGKSGSGAVFFSGCPLHCVFCQNHAIANGTVGKAVSSERLSEIFLELQEKGANNINLVTPTQFVPQIIQALERAKRQGLYLPIVYNTGSYENVDTIRSLEGIVDIYLPDLKYAFPQVSRRYAKAPDYFEKATEAIAEMVRQCDMPQFFVRKEGETVESALEQTKRKKFLSAEQYNTVSVKEDENEYLMYKGVIVRQLLLPTQLADARYILRYLSENYKDNIYISMMSQYTPTQTLAQEELNQKTDSESYQNLLRYAEKLCIKNAFFQTEDVAKESFIPAFDYEGV